MDITELKEAPYNANIMTEKRLGQLRDSIKAFGFVDPIIFSTKNNMIIGGHKRDIILEEEGITKGYALILGDIGWFFTDTNIDLSDDNDIMALNHALNKIVGEPDLVKIRSNLTQLKEEGYDVTLTGYEDYELKQIDADLKLGGLDLTDLDEDEYEDTLDEFRKPDREYQLLFTFNEDEYNEVVDFFRNYPNREEGLLTLIRGI